MRETVAEWHKGVRLVHSRNIAIRHPRCMPPNARAAGEAPLWVSTGAPPQRDPSEGCGYRWLAYWPGAYVETLHRPDCHIGRPGISLHPASKCGGYAACLRVLDADPASNPASPTWVQLGPFVHMTCHSCRKPDTELLVVFPTLLPLGEPSSLVLRCPMCQEMSIHKGDPVWGTAHFEDGEIFFSQEIPGVGGALFVHSTGGRVAEGVTVYHYYRTAYESYSARFRCERDGAKPCPHTLLVRRHLRRHGVRMRRRR